MREMKDFSPGTPPTIHNPHFRLAPFARRAGLSSAAESVDRRVDRERFRNAFPDAPEQHDPHTTPHGETSSAGMPIMSLTLDRTLGVHHYATL